MAETRKRPAEEEEEEDEEPKRARTSGVQSGAPIAYLGGDATTLTTYPDMTVCWAGPGRQILFTNVKFVTACDNQLSVGFADGSGITYQSIADADYTHGPLSPGLVGFLRIRDIGVEIRPFSDDTVQLQWGNWTAVVPADSRFSSSLADMALFAWRLMHGHLECWTVDLVRGTTFMAMSERLPVAGPLMLMPVEDRCAVLPFGNVPVSVDRYGATFPRPDLYYVDERGVIFSGEGNALCPTPFPGPVPQWVWGVPSMRWAVVTACGQSAAMTANTVMMSDV